VDVDVDAVHGNEVAEAFHQSPSMDQRFFISHPSTLTVASDKFHPS
jgi:hypothetical protein